MGGKRHPLLWHFGLSAYWFAASFKWFLVLPLLLPSAVGQFYESPGREARLGLLTSIAGIWAIFGPSIFGFLSDRVAFRFGRRRSFVLAGAIVTTCALLIMQAAPNYWVLVVGFLFLQIGDDMAQGPYSSLIPELIQREERGRASGVMGLLQLSANVAGAIAGLMLREHWKVLFLIIAGVQLLCVAATVATVRESASYNVRRSALPEFLSGWLNPWRSGDFRWVWAARFFTASGYYAIQTYLLYYLQGEMHRSGGASLFGITIATATTRQEAHSAAFLGLIIIGVILSFVGGITSLIGGKLADVVGRKKVIYAAGALMCTAVAPAVLLPSYSTLVVIAALFGIGYGAYLSADWALASDVMPSRDDLGKDMGIWQSSVPVAQVAVGMLGVGVAAGEAYAPGLGYRVAFGGAVVLFAAGVVMVSRIRGTR